MNAHEITQNVMKSLSVSKAMVAAARDSILSAARDQSDTAKILQVAGYALPDKIDQSNNEGEVARLIAEALSRRLAAMEAIWQLLGEAQIVAMTRELTDKSHGVRAGGGIGYSLQVDIPLTVPATLTLAPSLRFPAPA